MSHAFSLPFIAQVKIDCHVPERVHNCVCLCVCVCVCACMRLCMPLCAQAWHRIRDGWIMLSAFADLFSLDSFPVSFGQVGEGLPGS